ncbi:hypothetical protein [Ktedonospora formicarum]|uniref:Uncharacterized protein n=1 Tax=Ktedonospora formicarum TaxID=2778364 RepID=A0A8J3MYX3_9CHLR|nr:hypothetical protein [Ktedonospora formicarum]GHO50135.1 hypothetical protein KSX_82980 [Ktedonospora formicarum]
MREIEKATAKLEEKLEPIKRRYQTLRARNFPPLRREKQIFNTDLEKVTAEYEEALRAVNKRILTLNVNTPPAMHQPLIQVEKRLQQFREACSPFDL